MKLTKAQRRYLAEAHHEYWLRPRTPPAVAMWRKLHAAGLLERDERPNGQKPVVPIAVYRLTPAGLAALKGSGNGD